MIKQGDEDAGIKSYKATPSSKNQKSSLNKSKNKVIQSQFSEGYSPSFVPWKDHGSTKASTPPPCNCQRVVFEESKEDTDVVDKVSIFVLNPFLIGFVVSLICGVFLV